MTFKLSVINNSSRKVVAPVNGLSYPTGAQAAVFVSGWGCVTVASMAMPDRSAGVSVTTGGVTRISGLADNGACTLVLGADQSWTLVMPSGSLTGVIGGPVGAFFTVPASAQIYLTGLSNAGYQQRMVLTITGGQPSQSWTGTGESNHHICDATLFTPSGSGMIDAAVSMQNSSDNGSHWNDSKIAPVGQYQIMGFNQRVIISEDSTDNDYNDCAMVVQWWINS